MFSSFQLLLVAITMVVGLGVACHVLRHRVRNADVMRNAMWLASVVLALVAVGASMGVGDAADDSGHHAGQATDLISRPDSVDGATGRPDPTHETRGR